MCRLSHHLDRFDTASSVVAPFTVSSQSKLTKFGPLTATTIEEGMEQRVHFQGLIDKALDYTARYPPQTVL